MTRQLLGLCAVANMLLPSRFRQHQLWDPLLRSNQHLAAGGHQTIIYDLADYRHDGDCELKPNRFFANIAAFLNELLSNLRFAPVWAVLLSLSMRCYVIQPAALAAPSLSCTVSTSTNIVGKEGEPDLKSFLF